MGAVPAVGAVFPATPVPAPLIVPPPSMFAPSPPLSAHDTTHPAGIKSRLAMLKSFMSAPRHVPFGPFTFTREQCANTCVFKLDFFPNFRVSRGEATPHGLHPQE
jgi:hypothetical protein